MPKAAKFTREEVVEKGMELVRGEGAKALTARALGKALGSSACPIFTLFKNMEEVLFEVIKGANSLYNRYIEEDIKSGKFPPYKASGMAYIRFAREEKELFKLLFMRDRTGEVVVEEREAIRPLLSLLQNDLGLDEDGAYLFHLEMWIYVHGIATMIATGYLDWDMQFVSRALTDMYSGLKGGITGGDRH